MDKSIDTNLNLYECFCCRQAYTD